MVQAESEQKAMEIAESKKKEIGWTFGEETIDYAIAMEEEV